MGGSWAPEGSQTNRFLDAADGAYPPQVLRAFASAHLSAMARLYLPTMKDEVRGMDAAESHWALYTSFMEAAGLLRLLPPSGAATGASAGKTLPLEWDPVSPPSPLNSLNGAWSKGWLMR